MRSLHKGRHRLWASEIDQNENEDERPDCVSRVVNCRNPEELTALLAWHVKGQDMLKNEQSACAIAAALLKTADDDAKNAWKKVPSAPKNFDASAWLRACVRAESNLEKAKLIALSVRNEESIFVWND